MTYRIKNIRLLVRETKPARFALSLGKKAQGAAPPKKTTSPLCHVHLELEDDQGRQSFGCSADRLSVRWLDKRPQRSKTTKLRDLVQLLETASGYYLEKPNFETPFDHWLSNHTRIMDRGKSQGQEDLTSTYVSSLYERALIDGVCRLAGHSLLEMLASNALGFKPSRIHPAVKQDEPSAYLPPRLRTAIDIRHTVGFFDPLDETDWPRSQRLNDGLPETLSEIITAYGIRYFKVKVSGNPAADLKRLARVWDILPHAEEPVVTLDANEAFEDPQEFVRFLRQLERDQLGLFQHISFVEQPFPRRISLSPTTAPAIKAASRLKPLVIDESDATLDAFPRAVSLGYSGTSHKNCKGTFKSLANRALMLHYLDQQKNLFMSAEDLQNLPVVPLQQDLAMVSILGITHCERNGHHYNRGLSMLSPADKASVARHHTDLYEERDGEWYLKVANGQVRINSLFAPGFAVRDEPDWDSMLDLRKWVDQRYPA
jgi:hypothetical protein